MSDKETYTPPDKDGKCPHGVFVNSATCTKCYELKKSMTKPRIELINWLIIWIGEGLV